MRSIVYHQFRKELHIIKTQFCISSLRKLFWYTLKRDDMQSWRTDEIQQWQFCHCWWYTIAFAMDKKIPSPKTWNFLAPQTGLRTHFIPCISSTWPIRLRYHLPSWSLTCRTCDTLGLRCPMLSRQVELPSKSIDRCSKVPSLFRPPDAVGSSPVNIQLGCGNKLSSV